MLKQNGKPLSKREGVVIPPAMSPRDQVKMWHTIHDMRKSGMTHLAISKSVGLSTSSVGNYVNRPEPKLSKDGKSIVREQFTENGMMTGQKPKRKPFVPRTWEESREKKLLDRVTEANALISDIQRQGGEFNYDVFPGLLDYYALAQQSRRLCQKLMPMAEDLLNHIQEKENKTKIRSVAKKDQGE